MSNFWNKPLTRNDLLIFLLLCGLILFLVLQSRSGWIRIGMSYRPILWYQDIRYNFPHKICYPKNPNDVFCAYVCGIRYYNDAYSDYCSQCKYWPTHITEEKCREMGGRWDWE